MGIEWANPWWLLAAVPTAFLIWRWYREERRLDVFRKRAVAVLRSWLFLCLIFAVAGTSWKAPLEHQQVVFLADESKSIGPPSQAAEWIDLALAAKRPEDGYAVLGVGEKPAVEYPLLTEPKPVELGSVPNPNFTNLASGLRLAQGLFDPAYRPRVVLLSDGEQNIGDAAAEAAYLHKRGVRVDVVPLRRDPGAEVLIRSAAAPSTLYQGESFSLNVTVESTVATAAELRVLEDNRLVAAIAVQVQKGETRLTVPLKAGEAGFHRYRVELQPAQDTISANNTAYAYSEVSGRPSVLVVEGAPGEAKWLTQALNAGGMPYEVRPAARMPRTLEDIRRYAALVLANVSGTDVPEDVQKHVETAVRDFGVGLLMTGGQDSFGLGGYFDSPIEKALPVYMDIRNQQEIPSLGLVLVIDRSGSMAGEKVELAKEAARRAAAMLKEQDTLGVLAFDSTNWWVVEPQQVRDVGSIQEQISGITPEGGTEIFPALATAAARMEEIEAKRKHIILLTDGQSAPGDYEGLIDGLREKGVTMSTVAVGADADSRLLRRLAEGANGRFYTTTDSQNVPQIFAKETALAGKTYIQDRPFTPALGRTGDLGPLFDKGLPPINAQIATTAKETADTVLAHPGGEPLLARWQYGLGRTAAWTSDAKGVWSNQWAAWDGSSPFWNQLLTWLLPQYKGGSLDLQAGITAGAGELSVEVKDPLPAGAALQAEVIDSHLERQTVPLSLRAPGRYAGSFRAERPGTYMIAVRTVAGGEVLQAASTGVAVSYSPEYALPQNGAAVLAEIAKAGGGEVLSAPEEAFADNLAAGWRTRDVSLWFLLLAACIWPLDIGLRRVRISFARAKRAAVPAVTMPPATVRTATVQSVPTAPASSSSDPLPTAKQAPVSQPTDEGANIASRLLDKKRKR